MKFCIVCQYFPPEHAPIGVMAKELAEDLAGQGHDVTVVTGFPNHPQGRVFPGYMQRLFQQERHGKFRVIRCLMAVSQGRSMSARLLSYISFTVTAVLAILAMKRQDALMITSPPLTNGLIGIALNGWRRFPFVFNVQDLFPEAAIKYGLIKNRLAVFVLRWLERSIYRRSALISVISEGFFRAITSGGVPSGKVAINYNWLDASEVSPVPRANSFSRKHKLTEKFVVLYSGTIGLISGAEMMVECASMLSDRHEILFLFVGEGAVRDKVILMAKNRGLSNMKFLPFQDRDLLSQVQSCSDVSVVTLKEGMGLTSVPSKVLGYMAAARPVIASVDQMSDTRSLIERAECGLWVPPGDHRAMTRAILELQGDPNRCRRLGQSGRDFLLKYCERRAATARYAGLLAKAAGMAG